MMSRRLVCLMVASVLTARAQTVVVRAARVLDVEAGRMIAPGEVLVEGHEQCGRNCSRQYADDD